MSRYELKGPDGRRYEITAPDGMSEQDVLARFQREMGRETAAPLPQDESDRALRRGANRFSLGLANYPLDAWTALVHSGRRDSPGFGEEYAQQRQLTRQAISSEGRETAGTLGDLATDTAAYTGQALATAPLFVQRTGAELIRGGLTAAQAAYARLFPQATARVSGEVAVPAAEATGRTLPAIAELQAGQIPANQLTRLQIGRESGRVGAAFGVGEGYGNAPDSYSTGDVLQRMGEHAATGYAVGRAIPKAINLASDYVVGPVRNALTRRAQRAAERAQARVRDFEEAGVPEFTPALGGDIVQGTSSGLAGTVFGSSLRRGANESITALEQRLAEELSRAGGGRTPAETGDELQAFLRARLVERSRPKPDIEAMTPPQLQDISGVGPGPQFDPLPPTGVTAEPVPAFAPEIYTEQAARRVRPVQPREPLPTEPNYPVVPRETVGADVDLAAQRADLERAREVLAERTRFGQGALDVERNSALQGLYTDPFFQSPQFERWRPFLDRHLDMVVWSESGMPGRVAGRVNRGEPGSRHERAYYRELRRFFRQVGGEERGREIISRYNDYRFADDALKASLLRQRMIEEEELPALAPRIARSQQSNYEAAVAQSRRTAEEAAVRADRAAAFRSRQAAEAETESLRQQAREIARPEAEARAAERTRQLQADADARAQVDAEAAHAADVAARRTRAEEPFELGRSPESYTTELDAAFEAMRRNAPDVSPKLLGVKAPKGGLAVPRPRESNRYAPQEIEDAVAAWEATRQAPPMPETLAGFIRRMGGVQDTSGDVRHMLGGITGAGRMINNKSGRPLDDIAEAAHQAGFFSERPAINELLARLSDDLGGNPVVRLGDQDALIALREAQAVTADLDRIGVRGAKSADEVRQILQSERVTTQPPAEPRDLSVYDRTATANLLDEVAREARGAGKLPGYRDGQVFDEAGRLQPALLEYLRPRLGDEVANILAYYSEARARNLATPGLQGGRDIATDIGRAIRQAREAGRFPGEARGENDAMLSRLYDAVRQDIAMAARRAGPQGETYARQSEQINAAYGTFMQDIRRPLAKVFGENVDPVAAVGQLVRAARQGGNIDQLRAFYRVVDDKGDRAVATSWILHDMAEGGLPGFLTAYRALSQDAKALMFQGGARPLGNFLETAARVGGYLERFAKTAGDDYTVSLGPLARPGNLGFGLLYTLSAPALIKGALTAEAAARILASQWFGTWLKAMPVERGPRSAEWQRHMNRLRAFALEELGVNEATADALRDSFLPRAQAAPPTGGPQGRNDAEPRTIWDSNEEFERSTGFAPESSEERRVAPPTHNARGRVYSAQEFVPREIESRGRLGIPNEAGSMRLPLAQDPAREEERLPQAQPIEARPPGMMRLGGPTSETEPVGRSVRFRGTAGKHPEALGQHNLLVKIHEAIADGAIEGFNSPAKFFEALFRGEATAAQALDALMSVPSAGMARPRLLSAGRTQELVTRSRSGVGSAELASEFEISRDTVNRLLREEGANRPSRQQFRRETPLAGHNREEVEQQMVAAYQEGNKSIRDLAREFNISYGSALNILTMQGVKRAARSQRYNRVERTRAAETPMDRNAINLEQAIRATEDRLRNAGRSDEQIAEALNKHFNVGITADDLAQGNVWWRVGDGLPSGPPMVELEEWMGSGYRPGERRSRMPGGWQE